MRIIKRLLGLAVISVLLLSGIAVPVQAAPSGTLTINDLGTDSLPVPSGGVYEISSNITVPSSTIESALSSGNVILHATAISVISDLDAPNANSLTLKASGSIAIEESVDITSQGGDLIFWSDSDADGANHGNIRLGRPSNSTRGTIVSNGGNIRFGGGVNFSTGYAMGTSSSLESKPLFGVASWGFHIDAGGGDISMRARNGVTGSIRSILFESNSSGSVTELITSGTGSISILGDASTITSGGNVWGIQFGGQITTDSGNIEMIGYGGGGSVTNPIGIISAGAISLSSTSGAITFEDRTVATNNSGFLFQGGAHTLSTSGNISIQADEFRNQSTSLTISANEFAITPYTDESFDASVSVGSINATNAASVTIGRPSNSSNVTFNSNVASGGLLTVHGVDVSINSATSATTTSIYASGSVTQVASLATTNLVLNGSGSFTLQNASNNVSTITAGTNVSKIGTIKFTDASGGLTIGQVGSQSGIYSTNIVEIATLDHNLIISSPIVTTKSSGDSLLLYADQGSTANSSGTGNIIFSGSGSMSIESGARALIYSGARSSSTGLVSAVSGESNTLSEVATTTSIPSGLNSTGKYAFFRLKGDQTLTWSPTNTTVSTSASPLTPDSLASSDISGASIAYSILSAGTTNCTVNSTTAVLTFSAEGTCSVRATATAIGYNNATIDKAFTITNSASSGSSSSSSGSSNVESSPLPEPSNSASVKKSKTTKSKKSDNSSSYPTNIVKPSPSPTISGPANSTQTIAVPKSQFKEFASAPYPGYGFATPQPGQIITARNGVIFQSAVTSTSIDTLVQINGNQSVVLYFQDEFSETLPLSNDGVIEIKDASTLYSALTGFGKNSPVEAWIFSGSKRLGGGYTNSSGDFTGQFKLNGVLPSGSYTIQINTLDSNGDIITIAFGISKGDTRGIITTGTSWIESLFSVGVVISIALAILLSIWIILRRRENKKTATDS